MNEKIGVLLPFKDHFTYSKAGSASIWIKDFNKKSKYKKNIYVCGYTDNLKDLIEKKKLFKHRIFRFNFSKQK